MMVTSVFSFCNFSSLQKKPQLKSHLKIHYSSYSAIFFLAILDTFYQKTGLLLSVCQNLTQMVARLLRLRWIKTAFRKFVSIPENKDVIFGFKSNIFGQRPLFPRLSNDNYALCHVTVFDLHIVVNF